MQTITKKSPEEILIDLVRKEAKNIKTHATEEELNKLRFGMLDSSSIRYCVYGQMTTDCYSDRANELIVKCATRVYKSELTSATNMLQYLNGKPKPVPSRRFVYHSPIEVFIMNKYSTDKQRKNLIAYLKGQKKILILK